MHNSNQLTHSSSLLDRLLDTDNDIKNTKLSILQDLTHLLNTKVNLIIPDSLSEVKDSIAAYGLPNFSMMEGSTQNISDSIKKSIEDALALHEPRLKNISVDLTNVAKYSINFTINATFLVEPDPIQIKFDSNYQPNLQQFKVKDHLEG